jgi:hypothetical protein
MIANRVALEAISALAVKQRAGGRVRFTPPAAARAGAR